MRQLRSSLLPKQSLLVYYKEIILFTILYFGYDQIPLLILGLGKSYAVLLSWRANDVPKRLFRDIKRIILFFVLIGKYYST